MFFNYVLSTTQFIFAEEIIELLVFCIYVHLLPFLKKLHRKHSDIKRYFMDVAQRKRFHSKSGLYVLNIDLRQQQATCNQGEIRLICDSQNHYGRY